jgi:hypothetical protein
MSVPKYTQEYVDETNRGWASENDALRYKNHDLERQLQAAGHEQAQLMSEAAQLRCELRQFRNLRGVEG